LDNSKKIKKDQLGMDPSTASNRLKKQLMYVLAVKLDMHWCFQCAAKIESSKDMSIEHKTPWLHSEDPKGLFFDIDNIAFSHNSCNYRASRGSYPRVPCPSAAAYRRGCRCEGCKKSNSDYKKELRSRSY
tara:strand:- start:57 stop:446 length:390 start_codon:yes stop_codon:yes gene_type:complete